MSKKTSTFLWIAAFVFMAAIAIYQRMTGPTYPAKGSESINGVMVDYNLPRSSDGNGKEVIGIEVPDKSISGEIKHDTLKGHVEGDWEIEAMTRRGDSLFADLPKLPAAGKMVYHIYLSKDGGEKVHLSEEAIILRYKGVVPDYYLYPHIFFMFLAMVLSTRTGLQAIFKGPHLMSYTVATVFSFLLGGLILGPIIQLYAFGALWTGWPFGHDLTDNKTLASFILWIIAIWRLRKNPNARGWALVASLGLLAVYLIPHSVLGSEIDFRELPQ
jgi:hypothetical protein